MVISKDMVVNVCAHWRTNIKLDESLVSEDLRKELIMHLRLPSLIRHPLFNAVIEVYPEVRNASNVLHTRIEISLTVYRAQNIPNF